MCKVPKIPDFYSTLKVFYWPVNHIPEFVCDKLKIDVFVVVFMFENFKIAVFEFLFGQVYLNPSVLTSVKFYGLV